jgi:hypothetical protein
MGRKELRKRLEEKYKCEIHYDTVLEGEAIGDKRVTWQLGREFSNAFQLEGRGVELFSGECH